MKVVFKLVAVVFAILLVINYVTYQKSGNIPAWEWLASAKKTFNKIINDNASSEPDTVKVSTWIDAKGVVHYENRLIDGAKTIDVDPNVNVLPPMPTVKLPESSDVKSKTKNEELLDIQEAKKAHFDALTQ
jgi:hypothetical protein